MHQHTRFRIQTLLCLCVLAAAWPDAAVADYVNLSGSTSKTPQTPGNPASGTTSAALTGSHDFGERWTLGGGVGWSRPHSVPDSTSAYSSKEKDNPIFSLSLTVGYTPGAGETTVTTDQDGQPEETDVPAHWSFELGASLSPRSTELTATTLSLSETLPNKTTTTYEAPTLLKAISSSVGLLLGVDYDTAGDSNFETTVSVGVSPSRVATQQSIEEFTDQKDVAHTRTELKATCNPGTPLNKALQQVCKRITPLLKAEDASLIMVPISLTVVETLFHDTDVTLGATYYQYGADPNAIGYFTLATQGRKEPGSATFGTGVVGSPYLWSGNLSAAHKLGNLKLTAVGSYAAYYDATGSDRAVGLKVAYKIAKSWKATASAALQSAADVDGSATSSWSAGAAVKYLF